jgi:hypothetical protein
MQNDEQTNIEEEFRASWRSAFVFFDEGCERGYPVGNFVRVIQEIQLRAYDRLFDRERNGFWISRSREDSPVIEKSFIKFDTPNGGGLRMSVRLKEQDTHISPYSTFPNAISSELKALLDMLMTVPIE